jgi:hypothetical protein
MIKITDATPHDVGVYLHMAAAANNNNDLDMIEIINEIKEPVRVKDPFKPSSMFITIK